MKVSQTIVSSAFVAAQLWATVQGSPVVAASTLESTADQEFDAAMRDGSTRGHIATDATLHRRLGKSWWDKLSRDGPDPVWGWGRYRCFESGSWVKSLDIINNIDNICLGTEQSFTRTGFDYANAVKHSEQTYHIDSQGECEGGNCQANGGAPSANIVYAYFGPGDNPAKHAKYDSCKLALTRLTTLCHGDNQDTRGGFWWFDDSAADGPVDRSYYGFDPTSQDKHHQ